MSYSEYVKEIKVISKELRGKEIDDSLIEKAISVDLPIFSIYNCVVGSALVALHLFDSEYDIEKIFDRYLQASGLKESVTHISVNEGDETAIISFMFKGNEITWNIKDEIEHKHLRKNLIKFIKENSNVIPFKLPSMAQADECFAFVDKKKKKYIERFVKITPDPEVMIRIIDVGKKHAIRELLVACQRHELFNEYVNDRSPYFALIDGNRFDELESVIENVSPFIKNQHGISAIEYAKMKFSDEKYQAIFGRVEPSWY